MRLSALNRRFRGALGFCLIGTGVAGSEITSAAPAPVPAPVAQMLALRRLATPDPATNHAFQLEADVWWASPEQGRFVLHDGSGAEEVEMGLANARLRSGDRVLLTGTGTVVRRGAAFRLGSWGPTVDNDGIHSVAEKSGAIHLAAGRHPVRLEWFNGTGRSGLQVEYEGPGLPRQRIPDSALSRKAAPGEFVAGLECRAYEGAWVMLPDFSPLTPVRTGAATNFDSAERSRDNQVGLQFTGFLEVPREGLYRFFLNSDDGSRLFLGEPTLRATVIGRAAFPSPRLIRIGQLLADDDAGSRWAQVEGKVISITKLPGGVQMELRAGSGFLPVEVADETGLAAVKLLNSRIRAAGYCRSAFSLYGEKVAGALLVPGAAEIHPLELPAESVPLTPPLLTTASAVRELKADEARRNYPFRIQGVVTCVQTDKPAFVLQDSTTGLCMDAAPGRFALPGIGDFLEVEGVTDQPGIAKLKQMKFLGPGILPAPAPAAWDQLLNGSLDSQWVELGGLIESLNERPSGWSRVMLRSRAGVLKVDVRRAGVKPGPLEQYESAVVRLRGCVFADRLPDLRLKVGQVRMYDVDIIVDQPAPVDPFSVPITTAEALMRFDPAFDFSRRAKVAGQVVYARGADYFMMDGNEGLRFMARQPIGLAAGDLVEAVGYPELSGAGPVLRSAVARKTGQAALPEPVKLAPDDLIRANLDATRVRIEGLLTSSKRTQTNLMLEMQAGAWRFLARLNTPTTASPPQNGSRLELTGVYCAQGGYSSLGADFAPLDLLINSPADIRVLARPPWWTLQRLLVIVGLLVCAVALMVLWITQLRRQVEERSAELARQIQHREHVEHQRTMEQERARIAQDLHDQLGSEIATVSMLAARVQFASATDEKRAQYLDQVRAKAREMVASLDEIVWAMNPGHDSLASLESYLGRYAGRFLELANVAWRFEVPPGATDCPVDSRQRHQLFLAFREALANIVRHSGATEVLLSLRVENRELRLALADNGRGLPAGTRTAEMDGMANMRNRIEKLGGRFEITSEPGRGTTVRFTVPLMEKL